MAYLVLARKWRPKDFSETVGQEHVLRALGNALDSQRLHHAWLFTGTRGVGKTTIARILAKALNCERGISATPCGECGACREIDEGRFVDLIEVDAASKTKIDDTRELLDNVQFAPTIGRYKVYLIDEVHMLSRHSFNALLKTLEEPPPHVKFLLATTDPQKLPITVLSRCLQFNLKRLTPKLIRERLEHICKEEGITADALTLSQIARAADGSLRDALSLLDQAVSYCGGELDAGAVAEMLGMVNREHVSELLQHLAEDDAPGLVRTVARIDEQFPDYARLLDDLARLLQRIAVYQVVGATDSEDEIAEGEVAGFAERITPEEAQLYYQTALMGRRDLHLAPDPRSGCEMTLLRMLAFRPVQSAGGPRRGGVPSGEGRASAALPRGARQGAAQPQPAGQASPAAKGAEPPTGGSGRGPSGARNAGPEKRPVPWRDPEWGTLIADLGLSGADRLLAANCAFLRREQDVVYLALDSRSESLLTRPRQNVLAAALSAHFGEALQVEIAVTENAPAETPMQEKARLEGQQLEAARESLESDPNVRALKDMFGAQLNPDSIELVDKRRSANRE